jgi:hypothetical protein
MMIPPCSQQQLPTSLLQAQTKYARRAVIGSSVTLELPLAKEIDPEAIFDRRTRSRLLSYR